jgi:hypothetical protein
MKQISSGKITINITTTAFLMAQTYLRVKNIVRSKKVERMKIWKYK